MADLNHALDHTEKPLPEQSATRDFYGEVPLGVECAWPAAYSALLLKNRED
jgi:hypothetical protein